MYPQHVFKGKRMAGRMGHEQVTVKNLVVSYIDLENNLIGLRGAVPGPKKGLIVIGGKQ
jgi:large subunit ribosomal protein L3